MGNFPDLPPIPGGYEGLTFGEAVKKAEEQMPLAAPSIHELLLKAYQQQVLRSPLPLNRSITQINLTSSPEAQIAQRKFLIVKEMLRSQGRPESDISRYEHIDVDSPQYREIETFLNRMKELVQEGEPRDRHDRPLPKSDPAQQRYMQACNVMKILDAEKGIKTGDIAKRVQILYAAGASEVKLSQFTEVVSGSQPLVGERLSPEQLELNRKGLFDRTLREVRLHPAASQPALAAQQASVKQGDLIEFDYEEGEEKVGGEKKQSAAEAPLSHLLLSVDEFPDYEVKKGAAALPPQSPEARFREFQVKTLGPDGVYTKRLQNFLQVANGAGIRSPAFREEAGKLEQEATQHYQFLLKEKAAIQGSTNEANDRVTDLEVAQKLVKDSAKEIASLEEMIRKVNSQITNLETHRDDVDEDPDYEVLIVSRQTLYARLKLLREKVAEAEKAVKDLPAALKEQSAANVKVTYINKQIERLEQQITYLRLGQTDDGAHFLGLLLHHSFTRHPAYFAKVYTEHRSQANPKERIFENRETGELRRGLTAPGSDWKQLTPTELDERAARIATTTTEPFHDTKLLLNFSQALSRAAKSYPKAKDLQTKLLAGAQMMEKQQVVRSLAEQLPQVFQEGSNKSLWRNESNGVFFASDVRPAGTAWKKLAPWEGLQLLLKNRSSITPEALAVNDPLAESLEEALERLDDFVIENVENYDEVIQRFTSSDYVPLPGDARLHHRLMLMHSMALVDLEADLENPAKDRAMTLQDIQTQKRVISSLVSVGRRLAIRETAADRVLSEESQKKRHNSPDFGVKAATLAWIQLDPQEGRKLALEAVQEDWNQVFDLYIVLANAQLPRDQEFRQELRQMLVDHLPAEYEAPLLKERDTALVKATSGFLRNNLAVAEEYMDADGAEPPLPSMGDIPVFISRYQQQLERFERVVRSKGIEIEERDVTWSPEELAVLSDFFAVQRVLDKTLVFFVRERTEVENLNKALEAGLSEVREQGSMKDALEALDRRREMEGLNRAIRDLRAIKLRALPLLEPILGSLKRAPAGDLEKLEFEALQEQIQALDREADEAYARMAPGRPIMQELNKGLREQSVDDLIEDHLDLVLQSYRHMQLQGAGRDQDLFKRIQDGLFRADIPGIRKSMANRVKLEAEYAVKEQQRALEEAAKVAQAKAQRVAKAEAAKEAVWEAEMKAAEAKAAVESQKIAAAQEREKLLQLYRQRAEALYKERTDLFRAVGWGDAADLASFNAMKLIDQKTDNPLGEPIKDLNLVLFYYQVNRELGTDQVRAFEELLLKARPPL